MFDFVGVTDYHDDDETMPEGKFIKETKPRSRHEPRTLLTLDVDDHIDPATREWVTIDDNGNFVFMATNEVQADPLELRLCEQWTATARSVFLFDVQGSVAKSTHSGLPWLLWLREMPAGYSRVHFWPFDGFEVPEGNSVIAEVYPALYKRLFPKGGRTSDEHDAWSIAAWLQEADRRGALDRYFEPPLTPPEMKQAELERWILGVY